MILLVEDEDRARETFARLLQRAGYGDLVISDILMPNLNGYALVARIRSKWPNLPIILTSGFLSQDAAERMGGSVEFIPTPIDPQALIATVQRLVPRSS